MSTRSIDSLRNDPIGRALLSLAWPILCSGLLGVLDTSVNSMWVGRELGDVALAALSNSNLLWLVLFAGAYGVSTAGAVRIGKSLGGQDMEAAKAAVGTTVSTSGVVSVLCVILMEIWARPLLECLGTPAASESQAVAYLRVLLVSVPVSYIYGSVTAALSAAGESKAAFYASGMSIAIDVALNPLLIMGVGPVPPLGIAGSALATVTSQVVGLTALVGYVYGKDHALCLRGEDLKWLRVDPTIAGGLMRQGGPMAVQFLWWSIEGMLIISLVNRFGPDATAAYGATIQLWNFIMMPAAALGTAITSMVAQSIGAARWDRVRGATRIGLAYGVLATAILVSVIEALDSRAYRLILPSHSLALGIANQINRDATWCLVFFGAYTVWVGVLRATGVVWAPLAISVGVLAVRFPVTAALLGRWHTQAIWWSFPAAAAATAALAVLHGCLSLSAKRPLFLRVPVSMLRT